MLISAISSTSYVLHLLSQVPYITSVEFFKKYLHNILLNIYTSYNHQNYPNKNYFLGVKRFFLFLWFHSWRLPLSLWLSLWTWRRVNVKRWGVWRPDSDSLSQKLETWTLMGTQVILLFSNCKSGDMHRIYMYTSLHSFLCIKLDCWCAWKIPSIHSF